MKEIEGNLLDLFNAGQFDAIAHGCNCFNTMGSGIAAQIRDKYPIAYSTDQNTNRGDINKLGTFSVSVARLNPPGKIYNLYTQYEFGGDKVHLNYMALDLCLHKLNFIEKGKKIGLPLIGCGLAGGEERLVLDIIKNKLVDCDVTLVRYKEKV